MFRDKLSRYCWRTFVVLFFAVVAVLEGGLWVVRYVRRLAC